MSDRKLTSAPTWLVARREVLERTRRNSYRIATVGLFLIVVAAGAIYGAVSDDDEGREVTVAVVGGADATLQENLESLADANQATVDAGNGDSDGDAFLISGGDPIVSVELLDVQDRDAAAELLEDETADIAVDPGGLELLSWSEDDADLEAFVHQALRTSAVAERAEEAGIGVEQLGTLMAPVEVRVETVDDAEEVDPVGALVGVAAAILLLSVIAFYGNYLMMGVVEEKTTAVVEVLLGQLRPHQLITGKVAGMGVSALVQVLAVVLGGSLALVLSGVDIPAGVPVAIPAALAWFLAGFAFYAILYALAGSLVSRMEEAGQAAAPLTILLMLGYIASFQTVSEPGGALARWLSLLPPTAPLLMPVRMAADAAPVWEILLAAVLLVASCALLLRFAGRVYGRSILHRGSRLRWRQVVRSAE